MSDSDIRSVKDLFLCPFSIKSENEKKMTHILLVFHKMAFADMRLILIWFRWVTFYFTASLSQL